MDKLPQTYAEALHSQSDALMQISAYSPIDGDHPRRDRYCRLVTIRASDLIGSASHFTRGSDVVAAQILMRVLLEDLIRLLWATLSEENAAHLEEHGMDEFKAVFRVNLQSGTAQVLDSEGNDHSKRYLDSGALSRSSSRKTTEALAKEAGVADLYNVFYRFTSLQTHGNLLDAPRTEDPADVCALLSALGAITRAIGHTHIRWVRARERPSNEELRELLGFN